MVKGKVIIISTLIFGLLIITGCGKEIPNDHVRKNIKSLFKNIERGTSDYCVAEYGYEHVFINGFQVILPIKLEVSQEKWQDWLRKNPDIFISYVDRYRKICRGPKITSEELLRRIIK